MSNVSKKLSAAILSISLVTVMAGAAMAPALGIIRDHFASSSPLTVQLIVSLPAAFIIVTNLLFPLLCRHWRTRTLALAGLTLYVVAGAGAFFVDHIGLILLLRALLGISVGMIMPLSTGLISFYFPPEEQAQMMGLVAATNQLGGVVATLLAGLLAGIGWNFAFLVYLLGLVSLLLVARHLPNEQLRPAAGRTSARSLLRFHPSVIGMLLQMCIFFVFVTNFAITAQSTTPLTPTAVTLIMVGLDLVAFVVGLGFGRLMQRFRIVIKYFAPLFFLVGFACYAFVGGTAGLLIGSILVGIANGVGVPYLNTIASIKGGRDSATTVMPLLSASLYLGQFVSPLVVTPLSRCFPGDPTAAYKVGCLLSLLFLLQVFATRHFQSLPPETKAAD